MRIKSNGTVTVSQRLTALCGSKAARAIYYFNRHIAGLFGRRYGTRNKFPLLTPARNRWAIFTASLRDAFFFLPTAHCPLPYVFRLTAHRSPRTALLLSAFCLLLTAFTPSLTLGLLPRVFSQNETPSPPAQPTPAASPSPSPTPPPNLHQWRPATSFHGLPSDRTHAIAQTEFGVTWFATDGGLARYDGRRTNAINAGGLPAGRVLALKADESGALWIGTDNGAARLWNGKFDPIKETAGHSITAIITPQKDRAIMSSENGRIFDCQVKLEGPSPLSLTDAERQQVVTFTVRTIPDQPLPSADKDHPGSLKITNLTMVGENLYVGTQSPCLS